MDKNKILAQVKKDNVRYILLQFTDLLGIVKSLTIPAHHLEESLEYGTWFDGSSIEGFTRIYESDMYLKADMTTYAVVPWMRSEHGNMARFICDVYMPDGTPFAGDPRYILKKALQEASQMGYDFNTGPELEFFLFKTDNGALQPLPHDRGGYFDLNMDEAYAIRREMTNTLEEFGIEIEASHHEVAIGQHEIDFKYSHALKTADNAVTLKYVLKAIAQKHGLHATFMPKPIAGINGSGMHVHQSLADPKTGQNLFHDGADQYSLSKLAYNFIAGQLHHINAMTAILSPTVNSYKRLVPGYEAPVYVSWARRNRSALIRIPTAAQGKTQATRMELRCPDPTSNVYLAFAVMLKAGLHGIRTNMQPPSPVEEDLFDFDDARLAELNIKTIPHTLEDALAALEQDEIIKEALGTHVVERYLAAKRQEWAEYSLQVSQWELDKYLEMY